MKKNNIELLSPVGNFDCLVAAVQNGADSVYFGADTFSARASATNFTLDELKNAIQYAKIRNVKTNLTLNTLIKDGEFNDAIDLAHFAYENGIDAIIVQDLGLAKYLIQAFPDLAIHASTQMTIHNLEGALEAEKLGFNRVVLSREVTLEEIKKICASTSMEIEVFIHGALCISYSGQCLLSSMIGGRSGNRGRCAQPCRLPYKLTCEDVIKSNFGGIDQKARTVIDEGYLLSTRDLCGLEFVPELIKAGVKCFKIEGRMKPAEYVATVTRIYRKYIDLANSQDKYVINENDKKDLMQVFNRGGFSDGHFNSEANLELVYPEKPNNMGLFLGKVHDFNSNKGYITLKLNETLKIGDTISLEKETGTYTVSELMIDGRNSPVASAGQIVKIGRMKGNININNKIFKLSDKELSQSARKTFENNVEIKKIPLNCTINIKENTPISISVTPAENSGFYQDINVERTIDTIPVPALNSPITKERIISQICKTGNTPYEFKDVIVNLDDNLYIPNISCINELRRSCIEDLQNKVISKHCSNNSETVVKSPKPVIKTSTENSICVLLNTLNCDYNYESLQHIDKIYIPFKFFLSSKYSDTISKICNNFNIYIYMPIIFKNTNINLDDILTKYKICGFVLSNISQFKLLNNYQNYDLIGNYSLNIFNINTIKQLSNLGISTITLSPELDKISITEVINNNNFCNSELIVYGKTPVMNINYCLLGKSNKCYPNCSKKCSNGAFYLKDRMGLDFQIIPDNTSSVTTIYNSKITSIDSNLTDCNNFNKRIDFINENFEDMQNIIDTVISGNKLEGKEYTNGNFNKF